MNYAFAVTIAAMSSVASFKLTRSLLGAILLGGEMHEPEVNKALEGDTNAPLLNDEKRVGIVPEDVADRFAEEEKVERK
jgi:hypothetical protein